MFNDSRFSSSIARHPRIHGLALPLLIAATLAEPLPAADPPPAASVVAVKLNETVTKCQNHTKPYDYSQHWFYRRGDVIGCILVLSDEYKAATHNLKIIATHTFDGAPKKIVMDVQGSLPNTGWSAIRFDSSGYQQGATWIQPIGIQIPGDAAVGEYKFEASVEPKGAPNQAVVKEFPKPVVVLFNPWSATDKDVHYPLEDPRKEFVLETAGKVYSVRPANATAERRAADWSFDQFDKIAVKVTLKQLEGLSAADRASALKVSRHLVDRVAAKENDGSGGILIGRWGSDYSGGTEPTKWTRSKEIFDEFDSTGSAVKYGQCWVFAGLLTSMHRCLGIPSHTHSTFKPGWEKGKKDATTLDQIWVRNPAGRLVVSDADSDGWWSFHAWSDVRLRHEAAEPTWQSCDGTYGTKVGYPPFGPAPLTKIKAKTGGDFDVPFFSTAFDGDQQQWFYEFKLAQEASDKSLTGWYSTMKKVGAAGWTDITAFYKVPEMEPLPPLPPRDSSDLQIDVFHSEQVAAGEPITFELFLHNGGVQHRHIAISRHVQFQSYNGEPGGELFSESSEVDLPAGETLVLPWSLSGSQTVEFAASMQDVVLSVGVQDLALPDPRLLGEPTFLLLDQYRTTIQPIDLVLALDAGGPFSIGDGAQCTLSFANPLPVPAEDVVMILSVGDGTLVDGVQRVEIPLDPVAPGAGAQLTRPVVFNQSGTSLILGTVVAKGFRASIASVSAEVASPPPTCPADLNGDGIVNGADLGILLAAWGPSCDCECISPDLSGDGVIDGMDLGLFLNAWGLCPN